MTPDAALRPIPRPLPLSFSYITNTVTQQDSPEETHSHVCDVMGRW